VTTTLDEALPPAAAVPTRGPTPVRKERQSLKHILIAWSFALPFVLFFIVFVAGPVLISFITSLTDMKVTDIRSPLSVNFVGLKNYGDVLGDPTFRKAAANTAIFVIIGVPLTMSLGLLAAVGLNQGIVKFRRVSGLGTTCPSSPASWP